MKMGYVLVALSISAPGLAAPSEAGQPRPADQSRLVCRHVEAMSGSHVSRARVCRSAASWRSLPDASDDDVAIMNRHPNDNPNGYTPRGGRPN